MAALTVLWAPARTLSRVAEERRVLLALCITALYAALALTGAVISVLGGLTRAQFEAQGTQLPPELEDLFVYVDVFALVVAVVSPFLIWLLVSGLMQLVTRFFGGNGPFSGTLAAVGVAQAPLIISAVIAIPLTGLQVALGPENPAMSVVALLGSALGLAFSAWYIVLVVIGAAFARRVGYGESAGSCAISCGGCLGLIILAVLALVAVLVGVAGLGGAS